MNKKLFITIDTEIDADIYWKKELPGSFTSITVGIPERLRPIWDKHQINPIYFVSYEVLQNKECCRVLREEVAKGAHVGAHLHPEYVTAANDPYTGNTSNMYPCSDCTFEEEKTKLYELTRMVEEKIGVKPIWYRAARFGADLDSIKILRELGYQYDSSVTPGIDWSYQSGPDHSKAPESAYKISKKDFYLPDYSYDETMINEFPVTIRGKRWGVFGMLLPDNWLFYRWLRPTHMTLLEEKSIIRECSRLNQDMVMMFHSMEVMINKSPYVRNEWMLKTYLNRLDRSIGYAKIKGYASY